MSGKYTIEVEDNYGEALLSGGKIHEAIGYMVISENGEHIEIMEKIKDNKVEYSRWKKMSEN